MILAIAYAFRFERAGRTNRLAPFDPEIHLARALHFQSTAVTAALAGGTHGITFFDMHVEGFDSEYFAAVRRSRGRPAQFPAMFAGIVQCLATDIGAAGVRPGLP